MRRTAEAQESRVSIPGESVILRQTTMVLDFMGLETLRTSLYRSSGARPTSMAWTKKPAGGEFLVQNRPQC